MLIIQVALGVVLGVIILMFLPQILTLGIWAALLALGIAIVVGVFFLAIEYLTTGTLALVIGIGAIVIGAIVIESTKEKLKANRDKEKQRRRSLGYDGNPPDFH